MIEEASESGDYVPSMPAALSQLEAIFARLDQTAPENRTDADRAIGNLAIDMEERLLR
jgi:hypothetical protein